MDFDIRVVGFMGLAGLAGLILLVAAGWLIDRVQLGLAPRGARESRLGAWGRRGLLLGLVAAAVVAAHLYVTRVLPREVTRAREALELTGIEKWVDGISMFDDKVRIRFHYRNRSSRPIESFGVHFVLRDGRTGIIDQRISVNSPIEPGGESSWTEAYWSSCPQGFSAQSWTALLKRDVRDFDVEWQPTAVCFADGETIN